MKYKLKQKDLVGGKSNVPVEVETTADAVSVNNGNMKTSLQECINSQNKVYTCNDLSELEGNTTINDGDLACVNKKGEGKYVYVDTEHIFNWTDWLTSASSTITLSANNVFTIYSGWDIRFNGESLMTTESAGSTKHFKSNAASIIQSAMVNEPISTLSAYPSFSDNFKGYIEVKDNITQEWCIRSDGTWKKYVKDYYTKDEADSKYLSIAEGIKSQMVNTYDALPTSIEEGTIYLCKQRVYGLSVYCYLLPYGQTQYPSFGYSNNTIQLYSNLWLKSSYLSDQCIWLARDADAAYGASGTYDLIFGNDTTHDYSKGVKATQAELDEYITNSNLSGDKINSIPDWAKGYLKDCDNTTPIYKYIPYIYQNGVWVCLNLLK